MRIILELAKERIPRRFGFDPVDDVQVLTPMHKGVVGAGNLNVELQKALNPGEGGVMRGNRNYRVNDKVMQINELALLRSAIGRVVEWSSGRVVDCFDNLTI